MRLRRSQPASTRYWPEPINRISNDKTTGGDRHCSHDHPAGPGVIMAISDCRYLRSNLAGTGSHSSSKRQERIKTQLGGTSPCDDALRHQCGYLWFVAFSRRQIIDW